MTFFIFVVFVATYVGMALGRVPGLALDRAGIALIGAIALLAGGAVSTREAVGAIDFPTLFILFGLMILSAQFAASGFYDWCILRMAHMKGSSARLLWVTVLVAGGLSSVLANNVVVFAMTPLLVVGVTARGLDPRPFLIAIAAAANAGSAATLIGNPQNILIGQVGGVEFWFYLAVAVGPALVSLLIVFAVVWGIWHRRWQILPVPFVAPVPPLDRRQFGKGLGATVLLVAGFATPLPHEISVLVVAGVLLLSRRLTTRQMLERVDWSLLVLFAGLFIVSATLTRTGWPAGMVTLLATAGLLPETLTVMTPLALIASNTIGNVPTVMLLLAVWPQIPAGAMTGLAVLSTLAGNLFLVGSLANLITVERAAAVGVRLTFAKHARCGIPITVLSMAAAVAWLWFLGLMPVQ
ncbi:MAG: putative anion transporter [Rhodospirillaceae bacterium]|nr:MAG: putative anion transporter [Rhodospirillaceae bacterium]